MSLVSHTALTPLSFLERSARVFPEKTAVVYHERRLTYSDLAAGATRMAHALQASGVEPGDRVAYLMPNVPEMLVAQFAVPLAGAVLVSVNTRLSDEEIASILNHSGAKVLVTDSAFLPQVRPPSTRWPHSPRWSSSRTSRPHRQLTRALSSWQARGWSTTPSSPHEGPPTPSSGRSRMSWHRSRSTTPPAPPANPRVWSTPTAAPT